MLLHPNTTCLCLGRKLITKPVFPYGNYYEVVDWDADIDDDAIAKGPEIVEHSLLGSS